VTQKLQIQIIFILYCKYNLYYHIR